MENQREQEDNLLLKKRLDDEFDDVFQELAIMSKCEKRVKTMPTKDEESYGLISRTLAMEPKLAAITKATELKEKKIKMAEKAEKGGPDLDSEEEDSQDDDEFQRYDENTEGLELKDKKFGEKSDDIANKMATNFYKTLGNLKYAAGAKEDDGDDNDLDYVDFEDDDEIEDDSDDEPVVIGDGEVVASGDDLSEEDL